MPDNKVTTISPDELHSLQDFQFRFRNLTGRYGELYFQQKLIGNEMQSLDAEMDQLENDRIEYMNKLQETYGVGTVDINSGEFTPTSEPAQSNVSA